MPGLQNQPVLGLFQCSECGKYIRTAKGLKIHVTSLHGRPDSSQTLPKHRDPSANVPLLLPHVSNRSFSESGGFPVETSLPESHSESFGRLLASQKRSLRILHRIPKGARSAAAEAFAECLECCINQNSYSSWERLLSFSGNCLVVPNVDSPSVSPRVSLTAAVKKNIACFRYSPVVSNPLDPSSEVPQLSFIRSAPASGLSTADDSRLAARVQAKISDGDTRGAIRLLCSEDTFAGYDESSFRALEALHPAHGHSPIVPIDPVTHTPLQITDIMVRGAIKSFLPGSAGGPDHLRPQHIKDMISLHTGAAGVRLVSALTSLCRVMLNGQVPLEICPILYGASLCALKKKTGGIRPIAIGNTLRRLTAKIGSYAIRTKLGDHFRPVQLGFGSPGGAEAAGHAARRFIKHSPSQEMVFLKLDFSNAFNSINRDSLLQASGSLMPELQPFLTQCYLNPTSLFFGDHQISSCRGIQQGDPLGPALFCAVVHPLASSLKSEMNIWFLDDVALGGSPEVVLRDLESVAAGAASLGLQLNLEKCELFLLDSCGNRRAPIRAMFTNYAPDIRMPSPAECTLLGSPLTDPAISEVLESKTAAFKLLSSRLSLISAHTAFYILKNSAAIPKLTYTLRSAPTWRDPSSLQVFDAALKYTLEQVSNTNLSQEAWTQSSLPVSQGGLGVGHVTNLALPAFLASSSSVSSLVEAILPGECFLVPDEDFIEARTRWETSCGDLASSIRSPHSQKEWESRISALSRETLISRASNLQDRARLMSTASPMSGAFLNALPSPSLGTFLEDNAFRIAVALRLGASTTHPHTCVCGGWVDESGVHGLSCIKSEGRRSRHAAVNDLIRRALISAGYPSILEPSDIDRVGNLRPDGTTIIPWKGGKSLVWDFTCVDSQATSHLASSATIPIHAASEAAEKKIRKYASLTRSHIFTPIAAECLGSFCKEGEHLLSEIGRKLSVISGDSRAEEFFRQRISVAIQRGNAAAVMGTIPRVNLL